MRVSFVAATALSVAGTVLIGLAANPAGATTGVGRDWLDRAVKEKRCPVSALNVPSSVLTSADASKLRKRVRTIGRVLVVDGYPRVANHIAVRAGDKAGIVRVIFDGVGLGTFGPVDRVVVRGGKKGDVVRIGERVGVPARIEGGAGDDCLEAGAGGDVLLAGEGDDVLVAGAGGRPALLGGGGANRVVMAEPLGDLRVTAEAHRAGTDALNRLGALYRLRLYPKSAEGPDPASDTALVLAPADFKDPDIVRFARRTYAAGQAVAVVGAAQSDVERLGRLLRHPGGVKFLERGQRAGLVFFRSAPRLPADASPGAIVARTPFDHRIGIVMAPDRVSRSQAGPRQPSPFTLETLSQAFAATATMPGEQGGPVASAPNDLQSIADSYSWQMTNSNSDGTLANGLYHSIWNARSFTNSSDYYYVNETVNIYVNSSDPGQPISDVQSRMVGLPGNPTPIQASPPTTGCTTSTTSSVNWNVGGSAGWTESLTKGEVGLNAVLTGGVQATNTETLSCPSMQIVNSTNPVTGLTEWTTGPDNNYSVKNTAQYFYNQWLWAQPWSNYGTINPDAANITVASSDTAYFVDIIKFQTLMLTTSYDMVVPIPFGATFALQPPDVASVNPTCVSPGGKFSIGGSGFYPDLVTGVTVGGVPLSTSQFSAASDSAIDVAAPALSGDALPVVVQTQQGLSNSTVAIEIAPSCP